MGLVLGPGDNPSCEEHLLVRRERLVRCRGWHERVGILGSDPLHQFALVGLTGHDRPVLERHLAVIEPQIGLARRAIGTVACEAVLGQYRPDVAVVADRIVGHDRGCRNEQREQARGQARGARHVEPLGGSSQAGCKPTGGMPWRLAVFGSGTILAGTQHGSPPTPDCKQSVGPGELIRPQTCRIPKTPTHWLPDARKCALRRRSSVPCRIPGRDGGFCGVSAPRPHKAAIRAQWYDPQEASPPHTAQCREVPICHTNRTERCRVRGSCLRSTCCWPWRP